MFRYTITLIKKEKSIMQVLVITNSVSDYTKNALSQRIKKQFSSLKIMIPSGDT